MNALAELESAARSYGVSLSTVAWQAAKGDKHAVTFLRLFRRQAAAAGILVMPEPPQKQSPTIRDLIYHVFPTRKNDLWRTNVRQLLRRGHVFNGRRTIAIATDAATHSFDVARAEFKGYPARYLDMPNDPELRECLTFLPLLAANADIDSRRATFYAHTKGCTTAGNQLGVEYWRNSMYRALLDDWRECMQHLAGFAAVGTHKQVWSPSQPSLYPTKLAHSFWAFSGTFFWFRNDVIYRHRKWRYVPADRYGAEAWLGGLIGPDQAKSVYQLWPERQYPCPDCYNPAIYPEPITDDDPTSTA